METLRIKCQLDVASPFDFEGTDQLECAVTEHLVFAVAKGLIRGKYDGVTGMNSHRIKIFHAANDHYIVSCIPHYFKLDFLITRD